MKSSVLVTFFASNRMVRRGKCLPLCALLFAEMIGVVWQAEFDRKIEDQHSHHQTMLQEGLKNSNQGSLATWAKMAESWFAVFFKALLECAERKTIIGFVGLTCDLLEAHIHDLVFVLSEANGRNDCYSFCRQFLQVQGFVYWQG